MDLGEPVGEENGKWSFGIVKHYENYKYKKNLICFQGLFSYNANKQKVIYKNYKKYLTIISNGYKMRIKDKTCNLRKAQKYDKNKRLSRVCQWFTSI